MITVEQKPLTLTPSNVEHIYTFSSPNSGNQNFRYVLDVYQNATTISPNKVARLFVAPNTYAKGIVNLQDVVYNLVEGNARAEEPQYTSSATTGNTAYGLITNVKGIAKSNAYNDNTNYNTQYHVSDYRVMVGEQWTTGTTTVTYISTEVTTPGSTFTALVGGASNTDILWYAAGGNINEGSGLPQGITWVLNDQLDIFRGSGTSVNVDGTLASGDISPAPDDGDFLYVTETYSGIGYKFTWIDIDENFQWSFEGYVYPVGDYLPYYSPPAVTIWPGTALKQGSYNPYVYNAPYWGTTIPDEQQNFWEVKKYRMSGTTVTEAEPSLFLTSAGPELFTVVDNNVGINTTRVRRRRHHPSCPILVSWFNGILSKNTDFEFVNPLGCFTSVESTTQSGDYDLVLLSEYVTNGSTFTGLTPQNDRVLYFNTIRPDLAGGKMGFWTAADVGDYQYDGYGFSELLEYYIQEEDCFNEPINVLFMNRQGVWDTYTLDRRALETKRVTRNVYAKGGITNTNLYSQLSTNRRKTIYDQDITETMVVNTWYLKDNDKQILEDLFMSPEVYIIKDHDWTGKAPQTYNPYLLPVILNMESLQEFKNIYNKTIQYEFVLEYTPINYYNTQG